MSDVDHDDGFNEDTFKPLETNATPEEPATPPADQPKADPQPASEEPKKDEQTAPEAPKNDPNAPPADDAKKPEANTPPAQDPATPPETPPAPEEPKPITLDDIKAVINDVRTEERTSSQALEAQTKDVLDAYYPDGLSNVLTDSTGRELRTPQDVVEASNGTMSTEEAAQWLMNEQFKLDKDIEKIKSDATRIAETTLNFKRDAEAALQKYEPLFQAYPHLQQKVFKKLMQQTKADAEKGVILSAPDVMDHYDFYLEPYQLAFEHAKGQPATNPTPPPAPATPPPATPTADDRLDEGGDGGVSQVDDPNDFAQQVKKELAKGI